MSSAVFPLANVAMKVRRLIVASASASLGSTVRMTGSRIRQVFGIERATVKSEGPLPVTLARTGKAGPARGGTAPGTGFRRATSKLQRYSFLRAKTPNFVEAPILLARVSLLQHRREI